MPKAKPQKRRPVLLMPRFERHEIATLKSLIVARIRRAKRHIKAGRADAAERDVIAIKKMAKLHSLAMYKSV